MVWSTQAGPDEHRVLPPAPGEFYRARSGSGRGPGVAGSGLAFASGIRSPALADEGRELLVAEARHGPAVHEELRRLGHVQRLRIGDVLLDDSPDVGAMHVLPHALEVEPESASWPHTRSSCGEWFGAQRDCVASSASSASQYFPCFRAASRTFTTSTELSWNGA